MKKKKKNRSLSIVLGYRWTWSNKSWTCWNGKEIENLPQWNGWKNRQWKTEHRTHFSTTYFGKSHSSNHKQKQKKSASILLDQTIGRSMYTIRINHRSISSREDVLGSWLWCVERTYSTARIRSKSSYSSTIFFLIDIDKRIFVFSDNRLGETSNTEGCSRTWSSQSKCAANSIGFRKITITK